MIKIFLVDDHALIRLGLKKLISSQNDMMIVAEFNEARNVLNEISVYNPNIVICDISLPESDGLE